MNKYFVLLLLLFTIPSHADISTPVLVTTPNTALCNLSSPASCPPANNSAENSYDANSMTLRLAAIFDLQEAKKYTGVVIQLTNASVVSEDSTPPGPNEVATYDSNSKIITAPSITYLQDGSQHYHVKATITSFSGVATAANTYDANTGALSLAVFTDLQAATTYTDVVLQVNNVSDVSEDLTPPGPNEVATYDSYSKIITVPSITYLQNGSQHYHVKAVIGSFSGLWYPL